MQSIKPLISTFIDEDVPDEAALSKKDSLDDSYYTPKGPSIAISNM